MRPNVLLASDPCPSPQMQPRRKKTREGHLGPETSLTPQLLREHLHIPHKMDHNTHKKMPPVQVYLLVHVLLQCTLF